MRLPLFSVLAPVISSVVLWLVLGNPAVLLFALLGPLMAVGSFLDARRSSKKSDAQREADRELEQARRENAQAGESLARRAEAVAEHPPISWFVEEGAGMPPRWAHAEVPTHRQVRLGLDALTRMPVVVDLTPGLALVGSGVFLASTERSVRASLDWFYGRDPHKQAELARLVTTYAEKSMVPSTAALVLTVDRDGSGILTDYTRLAASSTMLDLDLLTIPQAASVTERLERTRGELGLPASASSPSDSGTPTSAFDLRTLDLVTHGPHAVLVGMTGSGKTEFLVSWLSQMMTDHSPDQLNLLILDYKGGVGLGRLTGFPHVVGLVSDLSPDLAQRVLASLRAEVRHRERVLSDQGAHDITALPPSTLPRLVVVIDEYRALIDSAPEAASVLADLASRGRALGIHLFLTTQQLGTGMSESILANCSLRVCFRMANAHDSRALLGADALDLPHKPGSAWLLGTALPLTQIYIEATDSQLLASREASAREWVSSRPGWSARRPWCEPLPPQLTALPLNAAVPANTIPFGLCDLPEEQRQNVASWMPERDGHLHVQGGLGSGRSTALRAIATGARSTRAVIEPSTAEQAWDLVVDQQGLRSDAVVVLDNLDALLSAYSVEHRETFLAALQQRLRTAPAQRTWFAISTLDHGSACAWVSQLLRTTLVLAVPTPSSPPGLTRWHGHLCRVLHVAAPQEPAANQTEAMRWIPSQSYLVVTHRVRELTRLFGDNPNLELIDVGGAQPGPPTLVDPAKSRVYLGDAETWQANYGLLGTLRREAHLVFDDCTPGEVRALRLHRGLLPHAEPGTAIHITPDGVTTRIRLEPGDDNFELARTAA